MKRIYDYSKLIRFIEREPELGNVNKLSSLISNNTNNTCKKIYYYLSHKSRFCVSIRKAIVSRYHLDTKTESEFFDTFKVVKNKNKERGENE